MIIDFRLRPPLGPFPHNLMYNLERNARLSRSMGMFQAESVKQRSIDILLQEMDAAGISQGVVPGRAGNPVMGGADSSAIHAIVDAYPDRFVGFVGLDPRDTDAALALVEQDVLKGDLKGAGLEPGTLPSPWFADDRRIYPLYDYCARHDVPVLLMVGGNAGPDVNYTHPAQADHVAADFPKLKLILSHGGWPWVQEVLHVAFRRPNIYVSPDMYLFNMPGWQDYVTAANYFLQDRFLFASSYPFLPVQGCVEAFCKMPFRPEVLPKLLYENAAALLGLD